MWLQITENTVKVGTFWVHYAFKKVEWAAKELIFAGSEVQLHKSISSEKTYL